MLKWWKRYTGVIAVVLAILVVILGMAVAAQAVMLYRASWRPALGTFPDWLVALGSLATFAVVAFAAREWRDGQSERRVRVGDQARLIVIQPNNPQDPEDESVVVWNHSDAPIYDVMVFTLARYFRPDGSPNEVKYFMEEIADPTEAYAGVLPPKAGTYPALDVNPTDREEHASSISFAAVTFTDALGRRWWRFGRGEPTISTPEWFMYSS
ncbi:hypothetical protein [Mycobacteroides abscessus]|uniref:hypothetical protein n=1 Tax=Mycobacteroides abscessus TaxID=36809 RepID=UPI000C26A49D|nr:hypothetical protein [Mycobacteroides abscessus]